MNTSLANLTDNLSEINNKDCKNAWREIRLNQNVNILNIKIID